MDPFTPTWYAASDAQKETWFNHFKCKYQYKKKYEEQIQIAFRDMAIERIPDYVYRAGSKGESSWMTGPVKEQFLKWRNSDDFKTKSATKKKNRTGEEKKAPGTHTMGRQNMLQFVDKISGGKNTLPNLPDLVKQSKTSKKGNFISNKVKKIFDQFTPRKEAIQASQPDTPVDENKIYYEAAGGYDKRGRVYGAGRATSLYHQRSASGRHSSAGEGSYTPGLVARTSQDYERMSQEYEAQGRRIAAIEEFIQSQRLNSQPPQTCHMGGIGPFHGHDFFDGDDGDGEGGGLGSGELLGGGFGCGVLICLLG